LQSDYHCLESSKTAPDEMINKSLQNTIDYCLHGFVLDKEHAFMNMESIEKRSWIQQSEMLKPDRIFSGIEEVIAEQGYAKASVEKIAARIGINKSSLYFYFKNKNDMLLKTIIREQEHFYNLASARFKELPSFPEKLYSFIIALTSYTVNNPGMITVLNWARYQNIAVVLPKQELKKIFSKFDFISQALEKDCLRVGQEDPHNIFIFIFFLIMHKLREVQIQHKSNYGYFLFTRHIFLLLCNGLTCQIRKKTSQKERSPYVSTQ
jgi:AcrR family transcriptional regulator